MIEKAYIYVVTKLEAITQKCPFDRNYGINVGAVLKLKLTRSLNSVQNGRRRAEKFKKETSSTSTTSVPEEKPAETTLTVPKETSGSSLSSDKRDARSTSPSTLPANLIVKARSQLGRLNSLKTLQAQITTHAHTTSLDEVLPAHVEEVHREFVKEHEYIWSKWPVKCLDHEYFATDMATQESLSGEPSRHVNPYPITGSSFQSCWDYLTKQFSNKRVLIQEQLDKLFSLSLISTRSSTALDNLSSFTEVNKSLTALGQRSSHSHIATLTSCSSITLLATTNAQLISPVSSSPVRLLIDSGSEVTFIKEELVTQLNIQRMQSSISIIGIGGTNQLKLEESY
ncbi:uncharacterized protein LOC143379011 [Andrena cerasifolii]|uniref:uncharacterized protein LOC143379011 n=1 Tax=Andrena cerasifolii TaxID=2819439 RepID=UPI00403788F5